jgi:hypothetical protein
VKSNELWLKALECARPDSPSEDADLQSRIKIGLLYALEAKARLTNEKLEIAISREFDAVAESGTFGLPGVTAVCVSYGSTTLGAKQRLAPLPSPTRGSTSEVRSAVVLMPLLAESSQEGFIKFVGYLEIKERLQSQFGILSKFVPELLKAIDAEVAESQASWKALREDHIQTVSREYKEGALSLFLGSGVSRAAKLPDWKELLGRLTRFVVKKRAAGGTLEKVDAETASNILITLCGNDQPIITAGILEEALAEDYPSALRQALYPIGSSFQSELLDEITEICSNHDGLGCGRSVITFNFDDLLEERLRAKGTKYEVYSGKGRRPLLQKAVRIFHVHGCLPRQSGDEDRVDVVLSERGYHDLYADAYAFANLEQLEHLRNTTCLMIGCSITDPNQRRLLAAARKTPGEARMHFAFLERIQEIPNSLELNSERRELIDPVLDIYHAITQQSLLKLGVNVIWFENFEEIPTILRRVRAGEEPVDSLKITPTPHEPGQVS